MKESKAEKRDKRRIGITLGLIAGGVFLMAYPFISNYLYERRQEEIIYGYQEKVERLAQDDREELFQKAVEYNDWLRNSSVILTDPFDPEEVKKNTGEEYHRILNPDGEGIMGYVEIPKISVFLPIYHGTSEEVLNRGVGHLENTSLPVGGEGTHCVLSAHTGLSDKKLFTDLILLETGDSFYIRVLNETLAYQVDDIRTVKPEDTAWLYIVPGQDHVTLVTCTPYGVNSHRLLVRGRRIPYVPEEKEETEPAKQVSPWMRQYRRAVLGGSFLLLAVLLILRIYGRRKP